MEIRNRIGISTLSLRGMPLEQAIDVIYQEGFRAFELVPHLYGGPEQFGESMRQKLEDRLSCFEIVTVHTSGAKLRDGRRANIASAHKEYRSESVEHYLEHVRLALGIGAKLATFHLGYRDEKTSPEQAQEAHWKFAQAASEHTKGSDLWMGYEHFDVELTREIGQPRFGILFDIGHAALQSKDDINEGIFQLMEEMFPFIVQFHAHGVHVSEQGNKRDHQPLQANNGIDYAEVLRLIKGQSFLGPVIFEIQDSMGKGALMNLKNTIYAREEFIKLWEEC